MYVFTKKYMSMFIRYLDSITSYETYYGLDNWCEYMEFIIIIEGAGCV
jgi:hypothetical protein